MRKESVRLLKHVETLGSPTIKELTAVTGLTSRNIQLRLQYLMKLNAVSRERATPIRIEGKRGGAFRVYKYSLTASGVQQVIDYEVTRPKNSVFDNGTTYTPLKD